MDQLHNGVALLEALLVTALVVGIIAERTKIPYTVALLLAALPLYFAHLSVEFGPWLLLVFLPALIFDAAWNLDRAALARTWPAIALLAIPGVAFTAAVVGFGLVALHLMPLAPALLLGIILSATDPVAVIATFKRLAVPTDLETIVEGESLFNDGAAVVLYGVALSALGLSGVPMGAHPAALTVGVLALGGALGAVARHVHRVLRFRSDPPRKRLDAADRRQHRHGLRRILACGEPAQFGHLRRDRAPASRYAPTRRGVRRVRKATSSASGPWRPSSPTRWSSC